MFLKVLEIAMIMLVFVVCITQLVIPAYRGQRLFPLFRRQGKLESRLSAAVQRREEEKVSSKIDKLKR